MPRIRSIYPEQTRDSKFVRLSAFARLLCIFLRNQADDHGVFLWDELELKMAIFPADNVDVGELLQELLDHGHVTKADVDGRSYGFIKNFLKYQNPRKPSYKYPLPDRLKEFVGLRSASVKDDEFDTSDVPVPHQCGTGTEKSSVLVEDSKGRGRESPPVVPPVGDDTAPVPIPEFLDRRSKPPETPALTLEPEPPPERSSAEQLRAEFREFYAEYPRKKAPDAAERAFAKARKRATHEAIMVGVRAFVASKPEPKFTPHPATWLNKGQWKDDQAAEESPEARHRRLEAEMDDRLMAAAKEADRRDAEGEDDEADSGEIVKFGRIGNG